MKKQTRYTPSQVFRIGFSFGLVTGSGLVAVAWLITNF
jgi:hypothetical protein